MFARKRMIVMGAHLMLSVCVSQIPLRANEGSVGDLPPADVSAASSGALGELALLGTERLGTRLYNQRRSFKVADGNMLYTTVTDLVFGAGQGDNLTLWQRPAGQQLWQGTLIRPERKTTMIEVEKLVDYPGDSLISYVDRQFDHISITQRVVYLERLTQDGTAIEEVISYSDGGSGVLNPVLVPYPEKGLAYWFIPDRTTPWRVRWFRVNLADNTWVRLDDIPMPASGARMYGYHRNGSRAVMPVGMLARLYVLDLDLEKETYTLHQIDEAVSPDGMPCREVDLHFYEDLNLYVASYLRPTQFSNRPVTGLLGEFVATTLDGDTLAPLHRTVIGGYQAEAAATHHLMSARVCDRSFVSSYTTVDKINQWHLNGVFANLVATHVDRWEVLGDGRVLQRKATVLPKTYNRQDMVMDFSTGILHLMVGETQDVFPLLLMDWKIDPLPSYEGGADADLITTNLTTAVGQGADAFVLGEHSGGDRSGENFGGHAHLNTRWNTHTSARRYEKSYFRFDLPDGIGTVTAATLALYAIRTDGNGEGHTIEVYGLVEAADYGVGRLGEDWGEMDITWANAPGNVDNIESNNLDPAFTVLLASFTYPGAAGTISLDDSAIRDFLNDDTNGLVTFILCTTTQENDGSGGVQKQFATKERTPPGAHHPPRLTLTYEPPPVPKNTVIFIR